MSTLSYSQIQIALQLHFSSLPAALACWLWRKAEGQQWTDLSQVEQMDWKEALVSAYTPYTGRSLAKQGLNAQKFAAVSAEIPIPQISWERWQASLPKARELAARSLQEQSQGDFLLLYGSPDYPEALYRLYQPPFALFARGNSNFFCQAQTQAFAVCGSRKASLKGLSDAFILAYGVCSCSPYFLASGLSEGIELAACEGALQAKRQIGEKRAGQGIVAVLSSGLDAIGSLAAQRMAGRILATNGLMLSEYPAAQMQQRYAFSQRNRILSALASSLIMAELGERSKALNLVNYAIELNQDIAILGDSLGIQLLREQGCSHWPDALALLQALHMPCESLEGAYQIEYCGHHAVSSLAEDLRSELLQQSVRYLGRKIVVSSK